MEESEESKRGVGRPTKYDKKFLKRVYEYSLLGADNKQIADFLEVNYSTLKEWLVEYPEFKASINKGREDADSKVAKALFKRAVGFKHKDKYMSSYEGSVSVTPIIKHYPPDTAAAKFWLTNRKGSKWKNEGQQGDGGDDDSAKDDNEFKLIIVKPEDD